MGLHEGIETRNESKKFNLPDSKGNPNYNKNKEIQKIRDQEKYEKILGEKYPEFEDINIVQFIKEGKNIKGIVETGNGKIEKQKGPLVFIIKGNYIKIIYEIEGKEYGIIENFNKKGIAKIGIDGKDYLYNGTDIVNLEEKEKLNILKKYLKGKNVQVNQVPGNITTQLVELSYNNYKVSYDVGNLINDDFSINETNISNFIASYNEIKEKEGNIKKFQILAKEYNLNTNIKGDKIEIYDKSKPTIIIKKDISYIINNYEEIDQDYYKNIKNEIEKINTIKKIETLAKKYNLETKSNGDYIIFHSKSNPYITIEKYLLWVIYKIDNTWNINETSISNIKIEIEEKINSIKKIETLAKKYNLSLNINYSGNYIEFYEKSYPSIVVKKDISRNIDETFVKNTKTEIGEKTNIKKLEEITRKYNLNIRQENDYKGDYISIYTFQGDLLKKFKKDELISNGKLNENLIIDINNNRGLIIATTVFEKLKEEYKVIINKLNINFKIINQNYSPQFSIQIGDKIIPYSKMNIDKYYLEQNIRNCTEFKLYNIIKELNNDYSFRRYPLDLKYSSNKISVFNSSNGISFELLFEKRLNNYDLGNLKSEIRNKYIKYLKENKKM